MESWLDAPAGVAEQGKFDYRMMYVNSPQRVYQLKSHIRICLCHSGHCSKWQNGNFGGVPVGHFFGIMTYCFKISKHYLMFYRNMLDSIAYLRTMPMRILTAKDFLEADIWNLAPPTAFYLFFR